MIGPLEIPTLCYVHKCEKLIYSHVVQPLSVAPLKGCVYVSITVSHLNPFWLIIIANLISSWHISRMTDSAARKSSFLLFGSLKAATGLFRPLLLNTSSLWQKSEGDKRAYRSNKRPLPTTWIDNGIVWLFLLTFHLLLLSYFLLLQHLKSLKNSRVFTLLIFNILGGRSSGSGGMLVIVVAAALAGRPVEPESMRATDGNHVTCKLTPKMYKSLAAL